MKPAALLILSILAAACQTANLESSVEEEPAAPQRSVAPVPEQLPAILAEVNGESIERWELEMAVREIEAIAMHPVLSRQRDALMRDLLDRLIGHHLAAQEARARDLTVSDAEVDEAIALERQEFPDDQAFEASLVELGTSIEQLRQQRHLGLEVARFVREYIAQTITVQEENIESYYRENLESFQVPETIDASHILIRIYPDASAQQRSEARAKVADILAQLRRGADFARLAQLQSQDTATAPEGGSLGTLVRGRADPAFEAVVFALEPGELSDVVETPFGYHVVKVHERSAARTTPLAEVRAEIEEGLSQDVQQAKLAEWVEQARLKATIEIYI